MKRALLLIHAVVLLLTGCMMDPELVPPPHQTKNLPSSENFSIVSVPDAETEEDWAMKAMGASRSAMYDFKGTIQAGKMKVWLDHYVKGKRTDPAIDFGSMNIDESLKPFKMYFITYDIENGKQMWILSVRSKGDRSNGMNTTRQIVTPLEQGASMFAAQSAADVRLGMTVDLATLVFSGNGGGGMSVGSASETIKSNDEVFILRCRFDGNGMR